MSEAIGAGRINHLHRLYLAATSGDARADALVARQMEEISEFKRSISADLAEAWLG